jgi:site-specific recombinase XerD
MKIKEAADVEILAGYITLCSQKGNGHVTIKRKEGSIKRFLNKNELSTLNHASITSYVHNFAGKNTYYQKRELDEIKKFLSYCFDQGFISQELDNSFPNIKAVKEGQIPSVYSRSEIKELLFYFSTADSKTKLRDYAIVLLIALYGLRSIDIAKLNFSELDFESSTISLAQSKTRNSISHQLLAHVGNAVIEYLLNERPEAKSQLIFLTFKGKGLSSKTIGNIVRKGFIDSGIDIGKRRHGSHSLRHSLASNLINQGSSIFTISNVLGQTSVATARLYAKVDISKLKQCALEVPVYE